MKLRDRIIVLTLALTLGVTSAMAADRPLLTPELVRRSLFGNDSALSLQILARLESGEARTNRAVLGEVAMMLAGHYPSDTNRPLSPTEIDRLPESQADLRVRALQLIVVHGGARGVAVTDIALSAVRLDPIRKVREAAARVLSNVRPPTPAIAEQLMRSQSDELFPSVSRSITEALVAQARQMPTTDRLAVMNHFRHLGMRDQVYPEPAMEGLWAMAEFEPLAREALEKIATDRAGVYTGQARAAAARLLGTSGDGCASILSRFPIPPNE